MKRLNRFIRKLFGLKRKYRKRSGATASKILTEAQAEPFFDFINEREQIYRRKKAKEDFPWSEDPVFQMYHFANIFRRNDRTTKKMTKRIREFEPETLGDYLWLVCLFRLYNWTPTFDAFAKAGLTREWDQEVANEIIVKRKKKEKKIWTGAYTTPGMPRKHVPRRPHHEWANEVLNEIFINKEAVAKRIKARKSVQLAVAEIRQFNMFGAFLAHGVVCDLAFTPVLPESIDEMTWCDVGPGSRCGMMEVVCGSTKLANWRLKDFRDGMRQLLAFAPDMLDEEVPSMVLRDIENGLCEFYKYRRLLNRKGRRGRIGRAGRLYRKGLAFQSDI